MTSVSTALLSPAAAAPSCPSAGAPRSGDAEAGGPGFAGALAAATDQRQAASPGGAEGAGDRDNADAHVDAGADDESTASEGATAVDAAAAPLLPWPALVNALEARTAAKLPTEPTDNLDDRLTGLLRARKGPGGDGREVQPVEQPLTTEPASNAAAVKAGPAPLDAAAAAAARPGAGADAPSARSAPAAVAAGGVPLPAEVDPARAEARRNARSAAARLEAPDAARAAPAAKTGTVDGRAEPSPPVFRLGDAAGLAVTRAMQDATAGELRQGGPAAVDGAAGREMAVLDSRLPAPAASMAGMSTPSPAAMKAAEVPPSFEARLEAALDSPEFVPSLGAQVSTLVRNGIPEARLHLHPAELGPITVQIEIDGKSAQVNMAVEHAATRQVLEQAIPTLATALRDNGLTLTGGGVFQQPREPQGQAEGRSADSRRRGRAEADSDPLAALPAAAPRTRRQLGALDLYA